MPPPAGEPRRAALLRALIWLALLLSVVGVGIAAYLAVENLQGNSGVCTVVKGCETVQKSKYGKILGVPISVPGLLLYLGLAGTAAGWLANFRGQRRLFTALGFAGSLLGALFSAYLTYLEAFVLDAWCIYCIVSAILMTVLLAIWTVAVKVVSTDRQTPAVPRP